MTYATRLNDGVPPRYDSLVDLRRRQGAEAQLQLCRKAFENLDRQGIRYARDAESRLRAQDDGREAFMIPA